MTDKSYTEAMVDAVHGSGVGGEQTAWKRAATDHINTSIHGLHDHIREVETLAGQDALAPGAAIDNAITKINAIAHSTTAHLHTAALSLLAARQSKKIFQITHNIVREPVLVDENKSARIFAALAVVEGVMTALFFLNGGFVAGLAEALGLGLTISSLNILLSGFLGGGFFGKYWAYGLNARDNDPQITVKRLAGRIGCLFSVLMIILLLLTAGIVRATGDPEGLVYSLETLGAVTTNFHALLLWLLGISFSILAWRKGLSAFSDPYPGFTRESQALQNVKGNIQHHFETACEDIEYLAVDAGEMLDDLAEEAEEAQATLLVRIADLNREREQILSVISESVVEFAELQTTQSALQRMIGKDPPNGQPRNDDKPDDDLTEDIFDVAALRAQVPVIAIDISALNKGFAGVRNEALKKLGTTQNAAIQTLGAACQQALHQ